ncbi:MAG: Maf family protein [Steroidobacterales bacterium]
MAPPPPLLILASASPRRSALLSQIGVPHRIVHAHIDERRGVAESVEHCVRRLAEQKARHVCSQLRDAAAAIDARAGNALPVLGADTAVVIDEAMLGKPRDRAEALAMLARLSGREHAVISAVSLAHGGTVHSRLSRSLVRFRVLDRAECEAYWATGEPRGKAGGYAIQGLGAVFVATLQGSYSAVMGLPLFETAALLAAAGVPVWQA